MSDPTRITEPMYRAGMVMLESAIRNGWDIPEDTLQLQLRRVQAVLDDPRSCDRARWRARRVLDLVVVRGYAKKLTPRVNGTLINEMSLDTR